MVSVQYFFCYVFYLLVGFALGWVSLCIVAELRTLYYITENYFFLCYFFVCPCVSPLHRCESQRKYVFHIFQKTKDCMKL